jgi:hypothetical protein
MQTVLQVGTVPAFAHFLPALNQRWHKDLRPFAHFSPIILFSNYETLKVANREGGECASYKR